MELLEQLVPDIRERLETAQKENPSLFEEIRKRAVDEEAKGGFQPFKSWQGCM
jgi:hypothetical protein